MPERVIVVLAVGLVACDVEVSLGHGDAGLDALHVDVGSDALVHADVGDDAPPDAAHCAAPDASSCEVCVAARCCAPVQTCALVATCPCIVECVLRGDGDRAGCSTHCGADGGEHAEVLDCAHAECMSSCP